MPHLDVYLNRTWAGQLFQDEGGRLGFSYREAFLHSPEAAPLSRHLPLRPLVRLPHGRLPFHDRVLDLKKVQARHLPVCFFTAAIAYFNRRALKC